MGFACVTGAAGGIGRATVARLRADGYHVLAVGRTLATLPTGPGVTPVVADVTDPEGLAAALAPWPALAVVVANAGRCATAEVADAAAPAVWREVLSVNLDGAFHTARVAAPRLGPGGRFVAISSGLGKGGRAGYTAYGAAKHGVIGLVRSLALEWAPRQITVNAVCPGWVRTAMSAADLAHHGWTEAQAAADIPLGRFVEPAEVAALVGFLASPRAAMITGQAYNIGGGEFTA
ncbi:MAG: SDR family oxidoreductase [Myxococcales bacterium]|nr:SDR family oxidoreductase [Myxococcales bacterium]